MINGECLPVLKSFEDDKFELIITFLILMVFGLRLNIPVRDISRVKKKGHISGNPKGKNPGDIWEIVQKIWQMQCGTYLM